MNRKHCSWLQGQPSSPRISSHPTVSPESSSHICCHNKHSLAPSWTNLSMWDLNSYQKLPFSSRYFISTIVYSHRPDYLGSTGPNKLLRPTRNDSIRHWLCLVSHHSYRFNGFSYDIRSVVGSPFGVLVFQEVRLIEASSFSPRHREATCTYLVYAVALNTARDMGARLMAMTIWGVPGKPSLLFFIPSHAQQDHHDV